MNIERLKAGTAFVSAAGAQGTAYFIASTRLATCHHVVKGVAIGGKVELTLLGGRRASAVVASLDEPTDCAILEVPEPVEGTMVLPLAAQCEEKAVWDGYGFPGVARGGAVPFFGKVLDPSSTDDFNRPMITLYSDMVASGMAAPINGLSGGPVAVDGAVIGHFSRVIGTPGAPGHPALGVVYAARSANVLALAGLAASVAVPEAPIASPLVDAIPKIPEDEYHVFISYRSTERKFAQRLYDRMDALGLRVFLDQQELVPGDRLAGRLHAAMERAHAAVVLVSRGWLESRWCQEEHARLVHRAVEDATFRLVPLRLENVEMPSTLTTRLWLDFSGEELPTGDKLIRVVYGVLGRQPPAQGTADAKLQTTDVRAVDEAIARVDKLIDERIHDPRRLRGVLDYVKSLALPTSALRLRVSEGLIGAGWVRSALEVLAEADDSLRVRELKALALSKLRRDAESLELLEPLQTAETPLSAETAGILGGVYKRLWLRSEDRAQLFRSLETYESAYERFGDVYVGVNVATLSLLCDDRAKSEVTAKVIIAKLGGNSESALDSWGRATLAEALLCLDRQAEALRWYRKAASAAANRPQEIAVMRRQARLIYEKNGWGVAPLIDSLPTPRVVAFSGHMTDAPDRAVPRFPANKVWAAREAIGERLKEKHAAIHGVCSAARGGDLIFLGKVLERNGTATVLLPFPKAEFIETSVKGAGEKHDKDWQIEFERVLTNDRVDCRTPLLEKAPPKGPVLDESFARCNEEIAREGEYLAYLFDDDKPTLLTLWNGAPGDGDGGTAHAVSHWKEQGFPHENIDVSQLG